VLGVLLYPVLYNLVVSTEAWSWFAPAEQRGVFVGLANYIRLLGSAAFQGAWLVTAGFVLLSLVLEYLLGLGMALVMSSRLKGRGIVRTAFLVPMMLAPAVVGVQWHWLLNSDFGVVYYALASIGLDPPSWLSDPSWALYAVVVADTWQHAPFIGLIVLAALQSIPGELYEAARVDGATGLRLFGSITLPLIAPASIIAVLIRLGDLLKTFDLIYVMTGGGPGQATQVASVFTYYLGFSQGELGQAASVANLVALVGLVAGGLLVWLVRSHSRVV
jgi:multiple sugar transport system permease protein